MCFSWLATRDLSLSTLTIHVYIAGPAQAAKHLLTTTRPTHDRSTRGNFGLVALLRDLEFDGPWGVEILSTSFRALPVRDALEIAAKSALDVL